MSEIIRTVAGYNIIVKNELDLNTASQECKSITQYLNNNLSQLRSSDELYSHLNQLLSELKSENYLSHSLVQLLESSPKNIVDLFRYLFNKRRSKVEVLFSPTKFDASVGITVENRKPNFTLSCSKSFLRNYLSYISLGLTLNQFDSIFGNALLKLKTKQHTSHNISCVINQKEFCIDQRHKWLSSITYLNNRLVLSAKLKTLDFFDYRRISPIFDAEYKTSLKNKLLKDIGFDKIDVSLFASSRYCKPFKPYFGQHFELTKRIGYKDFSFMCECSSTLLLKRSPLELESSDLSAKYLMPRSRGISSIYRLPNDNTKKAIKFDRNYVAHSSSLSFTAFCPPITNTLSERAKCRMSNEMLNFVSTVKPLIFTDCHVNSLMDGFITYGFGFQTSILSSQKLEIGYATCHQSSHILNKTGMYFRIN